MHRVRLCHNNGLDTNIPRVLDPTPTGVYQYILGVPPMLHSSTPCLCDDVGHRRPNRRRPSINSTTPIKDINERRRSPPYGKCRAHCMLASRGRSNRPTRAAVGAVIVCRKAPASSAPRQHRPRPAGRRPMGRRPRAKAGGRRR